ncbi:MAG: hypothetical protein ACTS6J_24440, partial [Burkholderiales bacterium]
MKLKVRFGRNYLPHASKDFSLSLCPLLADSEGTMAALHCSHWLGRKIANVSLLGRMRNTCFRPEAVFQ